MECHGIRVVTPRPVSLALLLLSVACSKSPAAPSPTPSRLIRLGGNLTFGNVQVGDVRTDGVLVIANDGNAALNVSGISTPHSGVYSLNWTSGTIAGGASQNVAVRFAPAAEQDYNGPLTVISDGTSGSSTVAITGTGTRPPRRGSVSDRVGDPERFSGVPAGAVLPDLVGADIEIAAGTFTMTVSFAPGTVAEDALFLVRLDTDENPSTGASSSTEDPFRVGEEYRVSFGPTSTDSSRATISRWVQGAFTLAGMADVTFPSAVQARITFPMSALDNDDGWLTFKVWSFARTISGGSGATDFMPNFGQPAGVVR